MKRLKLKIFLWSVLLISVFLSNVEPSSIPKRGSNKTTKSTSKPQVSTEAVSPRSTTLKSGSRNTPRPKGSSSKRTTTTRPPSVEATMSSVSKQHDTGSSTTTSNKKKQNDIKTTTTTTLSPMEVMNRLYQMHGLASHGISASHATYPSHSSSSNTKKKEEHQASSSMDDIYRLHALAIAQGSSHSSKKGSEASSSTENHESLNTKQNSLPQHNSNEQIYQQHSSLPSSMHHILSQHSVQSQHEVSRPQKTSSQSSSSLQESSPSSSSLSTLMQPLLKQLTPVGAGISVVLAPLLLFNGFLQFFSNMSRFLNNFAQTILPVRRPMGQNPIQNQNNYFQNLGPAHLKRQPREWIMHSGNLEKLNEFTELFLRALKEAEVQ